MQSGASESQVVPPPWQLEGDAVVLLLRTPAGRRRGLLPPMGVLAFVDYRTSGVGPYREVLHIPHLTHLGARPGPTVDRIWVNSAASVASGRANWGLPKDLATFDAARDHEGRCRWEARADDNLLASAVVRETGPRLPVLLPALGWRLLQRSGGRSYATPVACRGLARRLRIDELATGAALADVDASSAIGGLALTGFRMTFGAPACT